MGHEEFNVLLMTSISDSLSHITITETSVWTNPLTWNDVEHGSEFIKCLWQSADSHMNVELHILHESLMCQM
jgi:hypothetical protein